MCWQCVKKKEENQDIPASAALILLINQIPRRSGRQPFSTVHISVTLGRFSGVSRSHPQPIQTLHHQLWCTVRQTLIFHSAHAEGGDFDILFLMDSGSVASSVLTGAACSPGGCTSCGWAWASCWRRSSPGGPSWCPPSFDSHTWCTGTLWQRWSHAIFIINSKRKIEQYSIYHATFEENDYSKKCL